jgi:hypothetical protein
MSLRLMATGSYILTTFPSTTQPSTTPPMAQSYFAFITYRLSKEGLRTLIYTVAIPNSVKNLETTSLYFSPARGEGTLSR